jgi:hypothetical protein
MKRVSVILVAAGSTVLLSAASWRIDRPLSPRALHLRAEVARLRAHFDSVDTELRTRDVSHLSVEQRANRTRLIAWLREYRDAGSFPQNDRFPDLTLPFFRDSRGTLCAMAYLVDRSGRGDIVDRIAKARNNAYIGELTDDRDLVAWLDESGLSVAEAARIQPGYDGGGGCCMIGPDPVVSNRDRVSSGYAVASLGLGGSSLGTIGFNAFSPSRTSGALGIISGVATLLAGTAFLDEGPGNRKVAIANTAVGSIAALAGVRTLFAQRTARVSAPPESAKRKMVSDATIAPDMIVTPSATMLGFRVHARF